MIDYILAIVLIGAVPARTLYKSLRSERSKVNRPKVYIKSGAVILGLLVLLCYAWLHAGRAPTPLGLDIPLSERGMVGLAIAVALLVTLAIVEIVRKRRRQGADDEKAKEKLEKNDLLPHTRRELTLFLSFALLAGCGWELLYRGFLIWFFVPHVGTIIAVCIAALAYGLAHGYKSRMQFLGSIVSAFAFTIAFVLTGSLWWLMLIHTAAGVAGGLASYKVASKSAGNISLNGTEAASP
jgi:membrane protease YdiL (CAAX protease family)